MASSVGQPEVAEYMIWPNVKKSVFVAIGNSFKLEPTLEMNRADVYRHMKTMQDLIFINDRPFEKMVWRYVDQLISKGLIRETKSFLEGKRKYYWFTLTDKGKDLFRRISFSLNVGPDEFLQLIESEDERKKVKEKLDVISKRLFPAPSLEDIQKAILEEQDELT